MVIYRQRATVLDDFLLQVVFPWLTALHATPLLRLAHFWTVPVRVADGPPVPNATRRVIGVKLPGEPAQSQQVERLAD